MALTIKVMTLAQASSWECRRRAHLAYSCHMARCSQHLQACGDRGVLYKAVVNICYCLIFIVSCIMC